MNTSGTGEVSSELAGRLALLQQDFTAEEFAERRAKLLEGNAPDNNVS